MTSQCSHFAEDAPRNRTDITVPAEVESLQQITEQGEAVMRAAGVPERAIQSVNIAVDEIFSNIAHYSGAPDVHFCLYVADGCVTVQFEDRGAPYDPTRQAAPETALSAEEREAGGLGILIVRRMMSSIDYRYADGTNILEIRKEY